MPGALARVVPGAPGVGVSETWALFTESAADGPIWHAWRRAVVVAGSGADSTLRYAALCGRAIDHRGKLALRLEDPGDRGPPVCADCRQAVSGRR